MRWAEIPEAAATPWEWSVRMVREKGPDIKVFNSATAANEVFGAALAQAQHHQTITITLAGLGPSCKQLFQILKGYCCESLKV